MGPKRARYSALSPAADELSSPTAVAPTPPNVGEGEVSRAKSPGKRPKSTPKKRFTTEHLLLIVTWLEEEENRVKVFGSTDKTRTGEKHVKKSQGWGELARYINHSSKDTIPNLDSKKLASRWETYYEKYKVAAERYKRSGDVTVEERAAGYTSVYALLDAMCPHFMRMHALFSGRDIDPSANHEGGTLPETYTYRRDEVQEGEDWATEECPEAEATVATAAGEEQQGDVQADGEELDSVARTREERANDIRGREEHADIAGRSPPWPSYNEAAANAIASDARIAGSPTSRTEFPGIREESTMLPPLPVGGGRGRGAARARGTFSSRGRVRPGPLTGYGGSANSVLNDGTAIETPSSRAKHKGGYAVSMASQKSQDIQDYLAFDDDARMVYLQAKMAKDEEIAKCKHALESKRLQLEQEKLELGKQRYQQELEERKKDRRADVLVKLALSGKSPEEAKEWVELL